MDTEKPEGILFEPDVKQRVEELAEFVAEQQDLDVEEAYKRVRQHIYLILLQLQQEGEADLFGVARLKKDPRGGYKLHHYSEETRKKREQLKLQQQYGGALGSIGDRPVDEIDVRVDFDFPMEDIIEVLAHHAGVPVNEMMQKFQKQLDQAYKEMMVEGIGYLPDFGHVRCTGDDLADVEFDINEKVIDILKKYQSEKPDNECS